MVDPKELAESVFNMNHDELITFFNHLGKLTSTIDQEVWVSRLVESGHTNDQCNALMFNISTHF